MARICEMPMVHVLTDPEQHLAQDTWRLLKSARRGPPGAMPDCPDCSGIARFAYYLVLALQGVVIWWTTQEALIMQAEWLRQADDGIFHNITEHAVMTTPFLGVVRSVVFRNCSSVDQLSERWEETLGKDPSSELEYLCMHPVKGGNVTYWPPHSISKAMKASSQEFQTSQTGHATNPKAVEKISEVIPGFEGVWSGMEKVKSFLKKMSRQAQGMYRDIDYDVIRSPCLHSNLIFGKPKYLDKYLGMVIFESTVNEVQEAGCARASRSSPLTQSESLSSICKQKDETIAHDRKIKFDRINHLLLAVLVVKYIISNTHEIASHCFGLPSTRSRCDKTLEGLGVKTMSILLCLALQAVRGTMFLIVWRKGHILLSHVPEIGFACVVIVHCVVCILNEMDKFWTWSNSVCYSCPKFMTCVFWLGWFFMVLMCSIPMLTVSYFSFDFALKGLESCHLFTSDGAIISDEFKEAAKRSSFFTAVFIVLSVLEAGLWLEVHIWVPHRKKSAPEVTPASLSRAGGYVTVDGEDTEMALFLMRGNKHTGRKHKNQNKKTRPGMGQFYCIACLSLSNRFFASEEVKEKHERSKSRQGIWQVHNQGRSHDCVQSIAEAEAADVEELFCLGWEMWSEELTQAVASNRPWPMPPAILADAPVAAVRVAEAAMNAVATIWRTDVEYRKLLQHVEELQSQQESLGKERQDAKDASAVPSLPLHEQQRLAKALLSEEQEVRRLREREKALSEQLAAARATARKLKERDASYNASDLERQAALTTAKRQEATARQQFQDRESEIQALRREVNDLSSQLAKKDAVQASLSKQIRQLNLQLQRARQQREDLTLDLRHYLSTMQDQFALEMRECPVDLQDLPSSITSEANPRSPRVPGPRPVRSPARSLSARLLEFDRPESPLREQQARNPPLGPSQPRSERGRPDVSMQHSRSPDGSRSPGPRSPEVTEADILGDWDRSPCVSVCAEHGAIGAMEPYVASTPKLRILCLHGRCQTGSTFERKLERVVGKSESFADFVFVDAPLELPLQHGERLNTRAWWPDADRSDSAAAAVREVLSRSWAELGPFDGVLGFSEGAAAAVLCCQWAEQLHTLPEPCLKPLFGELTFAILAGAPAPAFPVPALKVKSVHFASAQDTVVPLSDSLCCAKAFDDAEVIEHDGGHCVPQRAEDIRSLAAFLEARLKESRHMLGRASSADLEEEPKVNQEQKDEIEALFAMFGEDELCLLKPVWPVRLAVRLQCGESFAALRFLFPPSYPHKASCLCELETRDLGLQAHARELLERVEASREPLGFPSVMAMVQAAQEWISDHDAEISGRTHPASSTRSLEEAEAEETEDACDAWWLRDETEVDETMLAEAEKKAASLLPDGGDEKSWARQCGAGSYGKSWEFIIGLVGKPSAGKSTLFNAATRPEGAGKEAAMAPHPFTTIDPNIAAGWFAAPCPSVELCCQDECEPEYGRSHNSERRFPLWVKDVAGLVPGAYMGRGRGNAFLNDLCDADSLIHVVDASGRSDAEGVDQESSTGKTASSDPLEEIGWVRREIHLWIFCNVRAKWDTVRRKAKLAKLNSSLRDLPAERLFALFTGYRASQQLAAQVYEATGHSLPRLAEDVLKWSEFDLHLLVACFLRVRFPIVVALNKADTPEAAKHISRVQAALGDCLPVSARSELWLWQQRRKGTLAYEDGGGSVSVLGDFPEVEEQVKLLRQKVLDEYGSTGVLKVLSQAVYRRKPIFCCPVDDFATLESLPRPGSSPTGGYPGYPKPSQTKPKLATMLMLRPLSTAEEVYAALKNEQMVRGDLVRAEVLQINGNGSTQVQVLRRDDTLRPKGSPAALVVRVLTNKKVK
ncbi:unnamed protein product [Symbiodinium sp. KB8]|nr:unnamed protein product [Symbiodinium sp. KB8]